MATKPTQPPKKIQRLSSLYENFWVSFEVSDAKLRLFRFFFFSIFAIDAWLQIAHAPRYGYGDFNVSHFPFLDGILPVPSRQAMVVVYTLQAYLGLRLALGGASRFLYVALALVFAGGYFISQLNSYQHHYLLAIALGLLAFFPWPDLRSKSDENENWPVRMLLVAMSVMYFFAFITKLEGEWTDGTTLKAQLTTAWLRDFVDSIGWSTVAGLTLRVELALVFLLHIRKLWPLTIVLGVGMHMAFEFSNLKIGLFSYFMVSLYLLLIPERWISAFVDAWKRGRAALKISTLSIPISPRLQWLGFAISLLVGALLCRLIPLASLMGLTIVIVIIAGVDIAVRWKQTVGSTAIRHGIAIVCLLLISSQTDALRDYYRFWGGNERRAGNIAAAISAYEQVVAIAPEYANGRNSLGNLYKREKRLDDALAQYEAGMAASPTNFKVHRGAAQIYHVKGMGPQALRAAELAVKLNKNDKSVVRIRDHWKRRLSPNATRP